MVMKLRLSAALRWVSSRLNLHKLLQKIDSLESNPIRSVSRVKTF